MLIELAKSGTTAGKENAGGALMRLAVNAANKNLIAAAEGAIPALVEIAKSGTAKGKRNAA